MDSGNSASLQSSSGGDDDFDSSSRTQGDSMSSFFNQVNAASISAPNPHFLPRQNPNFFVDDPIWSVAGLRPSNQPQDHLVTNNFPNFGGLDSLPSSSSLQKSSFPIQPTPAPQNTDFDGGGSGGKPPSDHHQLSAVTRNPKKRTRASRRAPTTVLTTDTANFRQMVQEFTGIPSSPFGAGASPYSRRLDLFSNPAALRLGGHFDTLGPLYSLRPQFPPPSSTSLLNSTMVDSIVPSTNITINPNSADHLLTLQNRPNISINPLQFSGFGHNPSGSRTPAATTVRNQNDNKDNDEDNSRWKSGGGNVDNDGKEEQEPAAANAFDGSTDNTRHHQHQHQHQHQISGHSRNFSSNSTNNNDILGEKGSRMGNGGSSSSPSGPHHQGTLAPWIYPSQ